MIVPQNHSTIGWNYPQADIDAICSWLSARECWDGNLAHPVLRSLLVVDLLGAKGKMPLWRNQLGGIEGTAERHAEKARRIEAALAEGKEGPLSDIPIYLCTKVGPDPVEVIERFLPHPRYVLGAVPGFHRICVLDCDKRGVAEQVISDYGNPILRHQTRREHGWHLYYPVRSWDDVYRFQGFAFTEGGDVICARRYMCVWQPREFIKAVEARRAMDDNDDSINWLRPLGSLAHTKSGAVAKGQVAVPVPDAPPEDGKGLLLGRGSWDTIWGAAIKQGERLAEKCNLKWVGRRSSGDKTTIHRWVGDCPHIFTHCGDPSQSGSRFNVSIGSDGSLNYICWKCNETDSIDRKIVHSRIMQLAERGNATHPRAQHLCDGVADDIIGTTTGRDWLSAQSIGDMGMNEPRADALRHSLQCETLANRGNLPRHTARSYYDACIANGLVDDVGKDAVLAQITENIKWARTRYNNQRRGR